MNNQQQLLHLLEKFEEGIASPSEIAILENWYQSFEKNELLSEQFTVSDFDKLEEKNYLALLSKINEHPGLTEKKDLAVKSINIFPKLLVASCFIMMFSLGVYLYLKQIDLKEQVALPQLPEFQAASTKAMLTLGDGKQILLDTTLKGESINLREANAQLSKEGDLLYSKQESNPVSQQHHLQTPKAGTFHLVLADGTQAWLNASSSISYPTVFSEKSREVSITGEVYFEVAHQPSKPFRVITGDQTIEVLGTHFNVNSYQLAKGIQTTLLEGSVLIKQDDNQKLLRPGEQAIVKNKQIHVQKANVDEVMAWKEGFFEFSNASLDEMMSEFSRWYDLDIQYEGPIIQETFTGRIPRTWSFSQVMNIMKSFKSLHLTVEGRRVMIRP